MQAALSKRRALRNMPQSHGVHDFAVLVHSARSSWFVTSVQQDASKTSLQSSLDSVHQEKVVNVY